MFIQNRSTYFSYTTSEKRHFNISQAPVTEPGDNLICHIGGGHEETGKKGFQHIHLSLSETVARKV